MITNQCFFLLISHFGTSKGNALDASAARGRVQGAQGR